MSTSRRPLTILATGFTPFDANGDPTADYGLQLMLKIGSFRGPSLVRLVPGSLTCRTADGSGWRWLTLYRRQHRELQPAPSYAIGDTVQRDNEQGDMVGPTKQGVEETLV